MVSRIGARRRLRHRKLAFPTEAVGSVAFADPVVAAPRAGRATARAGATHPRPKAHERTAPTACRCCVCLHTCCSPAARSSSSPAGRYAVRQDCHLTVMQ
jgi:hypothetical protein